MSTINIVVEGYGCSANQNDLELLVGALEKAGCNVIIGDATKQADIAIINTCIVKGPTVKRMERRIADILKVNQKLIVAGCMSLFADRIRQIKQKIEQAHGKRYVSIINTNSALLNIKQIISKLLEGKETVENETGSLAPKLMVPKRRLNKIIGISQIGIGCASNCSFCVTKLVKGQIRSYPIELIVKNVCQDLREGCKEIWLTATDLSCYGLDKGKLALPDLLKELFKLKGRFWIRLGMMNPTYLKQFSDELFDCYNDEKLFKFLHIPLQSGSNEVLAEMARGYSVDDWLELVLEFRKRFPNGVIATDIITGFYNETEQAFNETLEVIKKARPDVLHISRFWPMPGTQAYKKIQKLSKEQLKELFENAKSRSKLLHTLHRKIALERNSAFIGKELEVLIEQKGYPGSYLARDQNYRLVAIKTDTTKTDTTDTTDANFRPGNFYKLKIKAACSNFLIA